MSAPGLRLRLHLRGGDPTAALHRVCSVLLHQRVRILAFSFTAAASALPRDDDRLVIDLAPIDAAAAEQLAKRLAREIPVRAVETLPAGAGGGGTAPPVGP